MIVMNLGCVQTANAAPESAYGVVRSSNVICDAMFMAAQGAIIGVLLGNPLLCALAGAVASISDRMFAPLLSSLPGWSYSIVGIPIGPKNILLALISITLGYLVAQSGICLVALAARRLSA